MTGQTEARSRLYIWFDTEYSGLDLETAFLLQVAAVITDSSLRRVLPAEQDLRLTIRIARGAEVSQWVEEHLPDLVRSCRSPESVDVAKADRMLAAYVDAAAGPPAKREADRPVLAGNSVHADWWLLRRFLPRLLKRLHYRHLDVTAFKLEWQRLQGGEEFDKANKRTLCKYFPEAVLPSSDGRHDAYYDAQASIAEMAFYRHHLLRKGKPA